MPNKDDHARHRIVVEEVEIPNETEKTEIISGDANISSQDLTSKEEKEAVVIAETKSEPQAPVEASPSPISNSKPDLGFEPVKARKEKSPIFWILVPGIFILGAILGGVVFYQKGVNTIKVEETPTPSISPDVTQSATPIPSASPSATVDVSKFDIAIYNGSGTPGEAGKAKDILTAAGFSVTSTGNAATYDYTKTIIKAKSTVDASVIAKLKTALSATYSVGDSQTLTPSATTDIQVVVGSTKTN